MTDQTSPCLAAPEILAFLDGELAESRRTEIGRHLDDCRLCQAAIEGVAGLEWREGFLRSADSVRARVRARTATAVAAAAAARRPASRFRYAPQYLTVAATVAVGVGVGLLLTRPGPGEALFRRSFEPYPSTRPVVRGDAATNASSSNALASYEAGDYRGALALFEDALRRDPDDPVARFYAGVSRLALGRTREAALDLERVLRVGDEELKAPAEWYLALAHLRGSDTAEARPHLERIAAARGFYQDKARSLLSELDRLDKRD
jgi:tetratricopeptide (TPR) repeat protein